MRLSLKTKFTLATSLLVLAVVAVVSGLYLGRLTRQTLRQADDNAGFVAQQVYAACGNALKEAAERGEAPASLDPADLREYVRRAFDNSSTLNSLIESDVGISPTIYEITISDNDGVVLVSSDASLRDQKVGARPPRELAGARRILRAAPRALRAAADLRVLAALPSGHRSLRRYSRRIVLRADPRRDLAGASVGGNLGARRGAALDVAGVRRQPHLARADRAHLRATGPDFRRPVRPRAGRRARRRTRRGEHEDRRHRKAVARRARDFQHACARISTR